MANNLFIALEGIDGSGKSTQMKLLADAFTKAGQKVYTTCEPSNGLLGVVLRDILRGKIKADHKTIAGMFVADRMDHLLNEKTGIIKKLQDGYTVITDRYYFSSYAYNGTHTDIDWVIEINKMCAQILRPDLNIFIDIPPEIAMQRINAGRETTELFETLDNLKNVRAKYMEAFEKLKNSERVFITDGNRPAEVIAADIRQATGLLLD